jgi:hypothetical protein
MRLKKEGSRGRRVAVAGALAATAMMAFGAASANAALKNLSVPFDDAALTLPIVGTADVMDPPSTSTISGTNAIEDTTGAITGADLTFPSFTGTASGVPVKVDFDNNSPFTGTLNMGTGALVVPATGTAAYTATVQLSPPSGTVCVYNPVNLTFTTTGGTPIAGVPFTVNNGASVSTTHGILAANWTSSTFPNGTGGDCSLIDSIVHGGNGQLALGNGFDLTPATPAPPDTGGGTVAPPPAKKKCKKAKKRSAQVSKKKCKKKKK